MADEWFIDKESQDRWIYHRVKRELASVKTEFQHLKLIDTYHFGQVIILDGKIQSAEADEYIYHEALVHPALIGHPEPRHVLVLGGGEGATLREVLRYSIVERVVMVDIDKEFVEFCKRHLHKWHNGSFFDKRASINFADAWDFIKSTRERFDVIIADISDPIEEGPACHLYTKEFYRDIINVLNHDGVFVTQATEIFYSQPEVHSIINKTVASVFPTVASYCEYIPSLGSIWGFVVGSSKYSPQGLSPEQISDRLKSRGVHGLRYYDPETHTRLFKLPLKFRQIISKQKSVASIQKPIKVFSNK